MVRASDFLFRMVLVAHTGTEFKGGEDGQDWIVNASLQRLRSGKLRASLTAENAVTLEVLTYPKDSDRIITLLPEEYWPEFIKQLCTDSPCQDQPALVPVEG